MTLDAAKAAKGTDRATIAIDALQMIAAIYHAENKLQDLSCEERQKGRDKKVRQLVDAFFAWFHKTAEDKTLLLTEDTRKGIQYCINQEEYLREFLKDGEIPLDNWRNPRSGALQWDAGTEGIQYPGGRNRCNGAVSALVGRPPEKMS